MASRFGGEDDEIADINITPFVDVILVVLIIFMVSTSAIQERDSIKLNLPEAASGEATETTSLGIALTPDGAIRLDGELVTPDQLAAALRAAKADNDDVICLIAADKAVAHGRVVWLLDLVKSAGVAKFAINIDKAEIIGPDPATRNEGVGAGFDAAPAAP